MPFLIAKREYRVTGSRHRALLRMFGDKEVRAARPAFLLTLVYFPLTVLLSLCFYIGAACVTTGATSPTPRPAGAPSASGLVRLLQIFGPSRFSAVPQPFLSRFFCCRAQVVFYTLYVCASWLGARPLHSHHYTRRIR